MDEYIKREDAIKHLRGACIAKYPLSFSYGIFASADEIGKLPTADVVPKSEVEKLREINSLLTEAGQAWQKRYDNAKAEVAREIFEEIEKALEKNKFQGLSCLLNEFAELKKKYAEVER